MADFVRIDAKAFREGARLGRKPGPHAVAARFDRKHHRIIIDLDSGLDVSFDPRRAYGLEDAKAEDLVNVEIVGAGGALHFPKLDAFFSVPKLLEGFLGPMDWARREARASASRANGTLGGRPRREPQPA